MARSRIKVFQCFSAFFGGPLFCSNQKRRRLAMKKWIFKFRQKSIISLFAVLSELFRHAALTWTLLRVFWSGCGPDEEDRGSLSARVAESLVNLSEVLFSISFAVMIFSIFIWSFFGFFIGCSLEFGLGLDFRWNSLDCRSDVHWISFGCGSGVLRPRL